MSPSLPVLIWIHCNSLLDTVGKVTCRTEGITFTQHLTVMWKQLTILHWIYCYFYRMLTGATGHSGHLTLVQRRVEHVESTDGWILKL